MPAYIARRLLGVFPVLFVISVLAFGLQAITPGDPAFLLLQAAGRQTITPQDLAAKRAELHLDNRVVVLAGAAVLIGVVAAVPLGTLAAYRRGRTLDRLAQVVAVLGSAVPGFWIALVFIFFLSAQWHLLPVFGTPTPRGIVSCLTRR